MPAPDCHKCANLRVGHAGTQTCSSLLVPVPIPAPAEAGRFVGGHAGMGKSHFWEVEGEGGRPDLGEGGTGSSSSHYYPNPHSLAALHGQLGFALAK